MKSLSPKAQDALAFLFLFLVTVIVYNSALLPGQTFLPADLLLLTPPWKMHAAQIAPDFHFVQRPAWDPLFQFYPARKFLADSLHAGRVPLWNPLSFSGTPFAADGQSAVFYPINWLFAVLPLAMAFGWVAALHTLLTGIFFYLYCRRMGYERVASLAGATVWMFCGIMVAWQMWQVVDAALCWLPLALYFWEGWRSSQDKRQIAGAALALGMSLLAGHLQFAFYVFFAFFTYAIYRALTDRSQTRARSAGALIAMLVLGIGVASAQLFATADLLTHSLRNAISYKEILATAMPPAQLVSLVAPDLFGGQRDWTAHPYLGTFNYYEMTAFCGAAALAFAAFGLQLKKPGDLSRYWLGLALFALLMGCGSPLYALFYYGVPLFKSFHGAARVFALLDFAVAALCVQGVQRLIDTDPAERKKLAGYVGIAMGLLILLGYRFGVTGTGASLSTILTHDWLSYGLTQVGIAAAFMAAACLMIAYAPRKVAWVALVVVAVDMLRFGYGVNVGVSASYLYPLTDETRFVSANLGDGRVLSLGDGDPSHAQSRLVPNSAMSLGWRDISGSDPLLLANYEKFLTALNVAQSGSPAPAGGGIVADAGSPILDRLNVKYIVAPRTLTSGDYRLVSSGEINVYQNPNADGEARLAYNWQVIPDSDQERQQVFAPTGVGQMMQVTPTAVWLNRDPGIPSRPVTNSNYAISIPKVTTPAPGQIGISAISETTALIVTSEVYDPGWQVKVDNAPVQPLIADTLFMAVPLTTGAHEISLHYLPPAIQFGLYLTCLGWLVLTALVVTRWRAGPTSG